MPIAAVELIARWHRYDAYRALKAARVIVDGRWSVDQLREAEKNARQKNKHKVYGRQYAHKLRNQVRDWATSYFDQDFEPIEGRLSDDPADILFARKGVPDALAAVLIFGPYTDSKEYDSRFAPFMGNVAGLASYCERVFAIVPDVSHVYWRWLQRRKLSGSGVEFYAVRYHAEDFDPQKISRPLSDESTPMED